MDLRFTIHNFKKIFPHSPMKFEILLNRPYAKIRKMRRDNSFNMINYLHINDIILILERGLKVNQGPNKQHAKQWRYFLENDIQEYLDNEHERLANSN